MVLQTGFARSYLVGRVVGAACEELVPFFDGSVYFTTLIPAPCVL